MKMYLTAFEPSKQPRGGRREPAAYGRLNKGQFQWTMLQYVITLGWALTGAVSIMGIGLAMGLKLFTLLTPKIDEIEELKKGNISVTILLAAIVRGTFED